MSHDVSATGFERDVIERSHQVPVVVDFWAPWCGPCRTLGPVLERLEGEGGGSWVLAKLNTDENQGLARRYGIQGIPAVKAFWQGKVVEEFVGAIPEPQVRAFLQKVVPDEAANMAKAGLAALAAGRAEEAEQAFRRALELDAAQPDSLVALAQAAVRRGDLDAARALVGRVRERDRARLAGPLSALAFGLEAPPMPSARAAVDAAPDDPAARYGLACALVAAGDHAEALEIFLGLVKRNRTFGDDAGRRAMLRVFDVIGARSPLADEYRRRLSMELFK